MENKFESLGSLHGDVYTTNEKCLELLQEIYQNLNVEDQLLRTYRREIGCGEHVRKHLIPLLIHTKNDKKIMDATVQILVNLTIPIECLLPIGETNGVCDLNHLLMSSKEAFSDTKSIKVIIDYIKFMIEESSRLNGDRCDSINNCLLLLRNILYIPEAKNPSNCPNHSTLHNRIIWNLFAQSIDEIIIRLLSTPYRMYWGITIVQVIALIYKDQHVGTLQKLLSLWGEASLSESSEDNESNTSPLVQGSQRSSPLMTSDPDSSDNGGHTKNESKTNLDGTSTRSLSFDSGIVDKESLTENDDDKNRPVDTKDDMEYSDVGYTSHSDIAMTKMISTSSNDDDQPLQKPAHQKTRYSKTKCRSNNELKLKKLVKRHKLNLNGVRALVHNKSMEESITDLLQKFTVDFLLKAYGSLVKTLHRQLMISIDMNIDTSHFFWLVTYFLQFAVQLKLNLQIIEHVLSYDIISYLVFQGVRLYEETEIGRKYPCVEITHSSRRLHLVVTAIREFLQALENFDTGLYEEDREKIAKLKLQICRTNELKILFVLLLRQYDPDLQNKQYLQDLIITNHMYLLILDNTTKSNNISFSVVDHLKEFASVQVMHKYGILLESFRENGEFVNNCIFTMMHHIAGDLENISALFQPNILQTFILIWETTYEICDDWSDLIEYVIYKFISISKRTQYASDFSTISDNQSIMALASQTEKNAWITKKNDVQFYLAQNQANETHLSSGPTECGIDNTDSKPRKQKEHKNSFDGDIKVLKEHLIKEKKEKVISWLQNSLLDVCSAKLELANYSQRKDCVSEPSAHHCAILHLHTPLVPWTLEQIDIMKHQPFILLLQKLGFILPDEAGKFFVRIPYCWSADHLLNIAQQLGPVDLKKSDLNIPMQVDNLETDTDNNRGQYSKSFIHTLCPIRYTPSPNPIEGYNTLVEPKIDVPETVLDRNDLKSKEVDTLDTEQHISISDTASVASDLTRMYVSEDEDKLISEPFC